MGYRSYSEWETYPMYVAEANYEAGDEFWMYVEYWWVGFAKQDFTVLVYSAQDISVTDD